MRTAFAPTLRAATRIRAAALALAPAAANAAIVDGVQQVDGLTIYLGVVPAAITRGHAAGHVEARMHGGAQARTSLHDVHIMTAVFATPSGRRLTDVSVTARVRGSRGRTWTVPLGPMVVNGATTYGGYTNLGTDASVTILIDVADGSPPRRSRPVTARFRYVHD